MERRPVELEDWAEQHAHEVACDVERHGVAITTGEARWRLVSAAAFIAADLLEQDGPELRLVDKALDARPWLRPGFGEEVAAAAVHFAGKAYFPADPSTSTTGIALPWEVAAELVLRLTQLLAVAPNPGLSRSAHERAQQDLAGLLVRLSSRITDALCWAGDGDIVGDEKIEGRRYLLIRACDACAAAEMLRGAIAGRVNSQVRQRGSAALFPDRPDFDTFLWELEDWITPPHRQ